MSAGHPADTNPFTHNPTVTDTAALDAIAALLSGNEWCVDTLAEFGEIPICRRLLEKIGVEFDYPVVKEND